MMSCRLRLARRAPTRCALIGTIPSLLKPGKVRAVRFETLEKICAVPQCQPGDLLEYRRAPG